MAMNIACVKGRISTQCVPQSPLVAAVSTVKPYPRPAWSQSASTKSAGGGLSHTANPSAMQASRMATSTASRGGGDGGGGCGGLRACGARVGKAWLVGQDPVPGTDMGEGKGLGMVHERSAWYASDHRGVAVEFLGGA